MNTKLNSHGKNEKQFLQEYNGTAYQNPSVTVDLVLFTLAREEEINNKRLANQGLQVLLVERGNHPYLGELALPGGFVENSESIDEAAYRELKEETNVDNVYMEQLFTWGDVNRDPRKRVISISYLALGDAAKLNVAAGDDASEASWYGIRDQIIKEEKVKTEHGYIQNIFINIELTNEKARTTASLIKTKIVSGNFTKYEYTIIDSDKDHIAFDHVKILFYSLERLRNKVEHTDIIFNLMPPRFTLFELQQVYEIILGKELSTPEFRQKIKNMVTETKDLKKDGHHGPSKLYKFNIEWDSEIDIK